MKSCLLLITVVALVAVPVTPIKVSVYYESLCPDSINFILNQLTPTFQSLTRYLYVDYIPYGFASITYDPWSMTCQHGPRECQGNLVTACMLEKLSNNTAEVLFVNCLEENKAPDTDGPKCAEKLNLNYAGVAECATGFEGQNIMERYRGRFDSFVPKITWVPWVVINGVYSEENQNQATTDFKKLICSMLTEENPPECQ